MISIIDQIVDYSNITLHYDPECMSTQLLAIYICVLHPTLVEAGSHNLVLKLVTSFYKELSDGITSKLATYLYSVEAYITFPHKAWNLFLAFHLYLWSSQYTK